MIRKLYIQNYAIIDELEIEFKQGLNIITGETGAGKSILLGALSLIQGQRADTSVLKHNDRSCIVEVEFDISEYNLNDFFEANDIDYDDITTIRRQISENGKSRAFINEIPVNLNQLKELTEKLIDIHSQHQNLLLGNTRFQLDVLDAFAVSRDLLTDYRQLYDEFRKLKTELDRLEANAENAKRDFDYLSHQLNELNAANLRSGELDELEALQKQLTHASEIKTALEFSYGTLNADELAVLSKVKEIESNLRRIESVFSQANNLISRIESCRIELKDIADEIDLLNSKVEVDDEQLHTVTQRIDLIYSLLNKHRLANFDELVEFRNQLESRVNEIAQIDFNLDEKRKALRILEQKLQEKSKNLSQIRASSAPKVEQFVTELLQQLGIKHAVFRIRIEKLEEFQPWGTDRVTFYFSANKQIEPQELSRVASGGELSRLMLSLKSLLVKSTGLPTIIFDEIDTGVSGEIADRMGTIIYELAKGMQVINITHLPQIAAKGTNHFLVYKSVTNSQSSTGIKLLTPDERVVEIAKMLSGEKVTDAALMNAKELLKSNVSLS
ncbi:MAG: DNA repair protein RecN [Tenuifilum sp.]|uniref:DNA repair protein RecN n=1 Tax=Tenuifilum sp. TaxID=2760880 RepID=UPI001B3CE0D1|nr:DNA repair protein RecN [Bacteroidales bacterium]HOK61128.1 DNA repair protein RecN [Tenuifilum sp.]MBP9029769.1 DNA repair protein RecN [Bacteroidales bacterium]HOK86058.1 DNA repair protein RecN [Tenuifilum sp.]HON71007.1 DNA repair protein RecN [Tenuifilum sp.]